MDNLKYDKRNGDICFREEDHKYFDANNLDRKFVSVTTMIHSFTQPFDKEFWSAYKALEKLLPADVWQIEKKSLLNSRKFDPLILDTYDIKEVEFNKLQQGILDDWAAENTKSCERGTKIHSELENSLYKKARNIDLKKYEIGGKFECRKDYTDLDLDEAVYPEYLIHYISKDKTFAIAGQIDLLVKKGNHLILGDYKTNKKIEQKGFFNSKTKSTTKMKFPLNTLDDVNYNHYALQLSTYAWIMQKINPEFIIEDLVLIHFDHSDNMTIYHVPYLKNEVERMLIFYKKELALEESKNKRQPIVY